MNTTRRIIIGIIILALLVATILGIESWRRGGSLYRLVREGSERFSGECVPVTIGNTAAGSFCNKDASRLSKWRFKDRTDKKTQEGWLLRDVVLLSIKKEDMKPGTKVRISSSTRRKSAEVDWKDVENEANLVLLAPTKSGTLKLAANMPGLDTREKWVQDVDRIEIVRP